jgi:hypothetical protein
LEEYLQTSKELLLQNLVALETLIIFLAYPVKDRWNDDRQEGNTILTNVFNNEDNG